MLQVASTTTHEANNYIITTEPPAMPCLELQLAGRAVLRNSRQAAAAAPQPPPRDSQQQHPPACSSWALHVVHRHGWQLTSRAGAAAASGGAAGCRQPTALWGVACRIGATVPTASGCAGRGHVVHEHAYCGSRSNALQQCRAVKQVPSSVGLPTCDSRLQGCSSQQLGIASHVLDDYSYAALTC
jgi:hypothetical protein